MRVLLVNPPWILRGTNLWRSIVSTMPPLGTAWLAAVLERQGHKVRILDAQAERMNLDGVTQWARDHGPFDIAGITATTPLIRNAREIAHRLRAENLARRIVLGGVHPTVLPEEVLAEPAVDLVVRGEGEETVCEIAAETPLERITGISFRQEGKVVHAADRALIPDLDTLPFPAYHLLPMRKYHPAAGAAKRLPATSILATRGCPGRCTFCYRIFHNRLRVRSGRRVAEEVKLLQDQYGFKEVCFYDDTFTAAPREVKAFCASLRDLRVDLTWSCFSRVDTFDEELFGLMKEAGCHQVMFGVETCSAEILKNVNKRTDPAMAEIAIRTTRRIGMDVRAAFMLGSPGETAETLAENIRYAIRLNPDIAVFNITTPFPGTEMFDWADRNGYLHTKNWDEYDLSAPVMELPTVSAAEVARSYRKAYRRFYLRPSYIGLQLARIRSLAGLSAAVRAFRAVVGV